MYYALSPSFFTKKRVPNLNNISDVLNVNVNKNFLSGFRHLQIFISVNKINIYNKMIN